MIRGRQFILNFLKYSGRNHQKEDYNFSSGKCLKKIFGQEQKSQILQKLISKMRVGWFSEPVLYLKQAQLNQKQIISWLQQVTNHQIFQFANKINDKEDPEENLLWFNSQSFHPLSAWLVNQFQKSIIKNFYNRKNHFSHLQNFKSYLESKCSQQITYLALTFDQLKLKTRSQLEQMQNSLKLHEINYLQELNSKIINSLEVLQNQKTKKRRNKKKLKKKSMSSSPFVHCQVESPKKKQHPQSQSQMTEFQQKNDEKIANQSFQRQEKQQEETQELQSVIPQVIQQKRDFEEDQNQDNKSSISHDRISPSKRNSKCRDRSLSPNAAKSTPNGECQNSLVSGKCYQTFTQDNKSKNQQFQLQNFDELKQDTNTAQKKKRRKKNKNQINVIEDMANKATIGLINKQLTGLIDNLGIQTNSLYESKVLAFQRVVYFIKNICPQAQGLLFGSNAVGLSLPTSDIDIVLHNVPSYSRQFVNEFLAQIAIEINAMGWIVSCSTYLNAKIPLVKLEIDPSINYFQTKRRSDYQSMIHPMMHCNLNLSPQNQNGRIVRNIQVDLSISMDQGCITGVQSTQLMKIWMDIYPQLQRILIAFKYVLSQKGFNSNFKGGIGGYCLFVMISAYFKQFQKQIPQNQGELFLNILKFYGQDFQNKLKSITLRENQSCFISLEQSLKYSDIQEQVISMNPLRIIDPLNQKLTSSSCHQYPMIKAEFRRIRKQLLDQYGYIQKQLTVNYNLNDITKIMTAKKGVDKWINKYQVRSGFCIRKLINGTNQSHQYE